MTTVRRFLPVFALLLLTAIALPALAEAPPPADDPRRPGQIAREGVDNMLRALDKFVAELPRYGLPEITAQGDILIPRKNPESRSPSHKAPPSSTIDL